MCVCVSGRAFGVGVCSRRCDASVFQVFIVHGVDVTTRREKNCIASAQVHYRRGGGAIGRWGRRGCGAVVAIVVLY